MNAITLLARRAADARRSSRSTPADGRPQPAVGHPPTRGSALRTARALLPLVFAILVLAPAARPAPAVAQIRDGATMTVLKGMVAVLRPDGTAEQPAPSGTLVKSGDEIRTLNESGATITFFVGTEIEMGEETILVVERAAIDDGRIDVSLRQVLGVSLHRVHGLADAGSSYRIDVGGAVALVRGTEFLVYGPTDENVVGIVCLDDCTPATTFAGCPMGPRVAYWTEVSRGQVVSQCQPFNPRGDIWNAPSEARLRPRQ